MVERSGERRGRRVLTELLETTDATSAVANYYPDPTKCGSGGTAIERRQTIMVRPAPARSAPHLLPWCERGSAIAATDRDQPQARRRDGALRQAVGTDYRTQVRPTVRHGTGNPNGKSVLLQIPRKRHARMSKHFVRVCV